MHSPCCLGLLKHARPVDLQPCLACISCLPSRAPLLQLPKAWVLIDVLLMTGLLLLLLVVPPPPLLRVVHFQAAAAASTMSHVRSSLSWMHKRNGSGWQDSQQLRMDDPMCPNQQRLGWGACKINAY